MENNFYVGLVCHKRKLLKNSYSEKMVLYSEDNIYYTDLVNSVTYTTNSSEKDYVISDCIFKTDINDYKIDYMYLLNKYKSVKTKIKKN